MADKLPQLLQALPHRIYNKVLILTFTLNSSQRTTIDFDYKPPAILQVNQATREALIRAYYTTTTFTAAFADSLVAWLVSLPRAHFLMLRDVRYISGCPNNNKKFVNKRAWELRGLIDDTPRLNAEECDFLCVQTPKAALLSPPLPRIKAGCEEWKGLWFERTAT